MRPTLRPAQHLPTVYLYRDPIDFRKSHNGLSALIEMERKCIYLVVYATLLMKVSCTQLSHSSGQLLLQTAALTDSTA